MDLTSQKSITLILEYYRMHQDLAVMKTLKEEIITDIKNDLPEFEIEVEQMLTKHDKFEIDSEQILAEHDNLVRIIEEQIQSFSDMTLSVKEHETKGTELLRTLQHQRIDHKRIWYKFLGKWYNQVESSEKPI